MLAPVIYYLRKARRVFAFAGLSVGGITKKKVVGANFDDIFGTDAWRETSNKRLDFGGNRTTIRIQEFLKKK